MLRCKCTVKCGKCSLCCTCCACCIFCCCCSCCGHVAHALIEPACSHSLSSCSFTRMQDQMPAPGSDATVSHFGCSTGHKQRVVSERTHTASLSLSHSTAAILPLSLALSLTLPLCSLLSRPHGRKTSFLITLRTTSFSSVTSSSARGLLSALISTFLSAALFLSPLVVLLLFSSRWGLFRLTTARDFFSQQGGKYLRGTWEEEERVSGWADDEDEKEQQLCGVCAGWMCDKLQICIFP